jgi:hypothetical protein
VLGWRWNGSRRKSLELGLRSRRCENERKFV